MVFIHAFSLSVCAALCHMIIITKQCFIPSKYTGIEIVVTRCNLNLLRYQGPRFYTSLSSDIQSAGTMTSFVSGLKTSLIDF